MTYMPLQDRDESEWQTRKRRIDPLDGTGWRIGRQGVALQASHGCFGRMDGTAAVPYAAATMSRIDLPADKMPEAEVALRLAFYLLRLPGSEGSACVAIDGAQVRILQRVIFPIREFLADERWKQIKQPRKGAWQGVYERRGHRLVIHSKPGVGDVVSHVGNRRIVAECKGGPLIKKPGGREYRALWTAIGQLVASDTVTEADIRVVAVPNTPAFRSLVRSWRERPLVVRTGIEFALVGRRGRIHGLDLTT